MKKLLKNKQEADKVVNFIKDKTEDKKLRENMSMELYQKLQSPITSKLDKLEHTIKDTDLYERMINQNLLSIEPTTANLINLEDDLLTNQPIEYTKQKTLIVDITKDIDKDVIKKYNIKTNFNSKDELENELTKIDDYLKKNTKKLTKLTKTNKSLETETKSKKTSKNSKVNNQLEISKNTEHYNDISFEQQELKKLKDNIKKPSSLLVGSGVNHQIKRQSYKLSQDGKYGNLNIDLNQLIGFNKLVVKKDAVIIINQDVDDDFIELITKRYNSKKTYSKQSIGLFNELTKLSWLPLHKTSLKFKKIINCSCDNQTIEYYNNPNELLNELEIIIGSLKSGNNSPMLLNNGIKIIDELLQKGNLTLEQHKRLYDKLIY